MRKRPKARSQAAPEQWFEGRSAHGKRIMLCANTSWYLYNFRANLIDALKGAGHSVVSAAPVDEYTNDLRKHVSSHYPLNFSSSSLSPLEEARLVRRFYTMLNTVKPDIMLNFTAKPNIYGSLMARVNGVQVINNVAGLGSAFSGDRGNLAWLLKRMYGLAFAKADLLFFQNCDDLTMFQSEGIVKQAQCELIPGSGVDLKRFLPQPVMREEGGPMRFLFVARMLKAKGVIELLEVARMLWQERPGEAVFDLCGSFDIDNDDAVTSDVVAEYETCPAVNFVGHVNDIMPYLTASHCVVLPSYYREGVPRSLLEALAIGRPIITTDMPGCRETLNGKNGWLIEPRDVGALKSAVLEAIELAPERLKELGEASRSYAVERFDEQIVIDRYIQQVARLAAPSVSPAPSTIQ